MGWRFLLKFDINHPAKQQLPPRPSSDMLATLLLTPLLAIAQFSDQRFVPAKQVKQPNTSQIQTIRKEASAWIDKRATVKEWKLSRFEFVGELHGAPADEFSRGRYGVYRMTFKVSPEVGKELQADMLFYTRGQELIWPPEQWSKTRPSPGQMNAAIRSSLKN